ncbi:reverse transcriptase domain-containing protein [Tanacetum coccineum]
MAAAAETDGGGRRVEESGCGDRIDPVMRSVFGVGRKSPSEKFSGGGATVVAGSGGGGGGWPDSLREKREFQFETTNNEAEYEALIAGLRIAEKMGVRNLKVNVDSKLVANQVNRTCIAKEADMIKYLEKVRTLTSTFRAFSIKQVPRSKNKKADTLSKMASTSFAHLSKQVLVEELKEKSVNKKEVMAVLEEEGDTWMTPIHEYLTNETLPTERKKARAIKRKSQRFAIINGILYKKSFLGPWLRCVGSSQANYVLREIHEGSCSMHAGTRSVVAKALRTGYYWPTMHKDARALIKACQECQVHKPVPRNPQEKLNPITSPWPFYKWGIDIAGPFPEGPGKVKFLIVAMDYFTKWIEAKPVATITGNQVKKFVWENIVCRFGLPGEIISDNGKQFRDNPFKDWCEKLCIQQHFASVKHPQTNGLVERANRSLREGIKARLGKENNNWLEEISHVLWAHRTMIKSSNGIEMILIRLVLIRFFLVLVFRRLIVVVLLGKDTGTRGTSSHELGSSWAMEVGNDMKVGTNGQMLVEEGIHFLEIADAIRSLGLTILKGVIEPDGDKTWMCFVIEHSLVDGGSGGGWHWWMTVVGDGGSVVVVKV